MRLMRAMLAAAGALRSAGPSRPIELDFTPPLAPAGKRALFRCWHDDLHTCRAGAHDRSSTRRFDVADDFSKWRISQEDISRLRSFPTPQAPNSAYQNIFCFLAHVAAFTLKISLFLMRYHRRKRHNGRLLIACES